MQRRKEQKLPTGTTLNRETLDLRIPSYKSFCWCYSQLSVPLNDMINLSFLTYGSIPFLIFRSGCPNWLCILINSPGWAMSLESGEGDWSYEFSFFSVVIQLTDVGHGEFSFMKGHLILNFWNASAITYLIFDDRAHGGCRWIIVQIHYITSDLWNSKVDFWWGEFNLGLCLVFWIIICMRFQDKLCKYGKQITNCSWKVPILLSFFLGV